MRPTLTTGSVAPYVSTAAICSRIFSFSRMWTAERSWKDSAQSPAWSRNARPCRHLGERRRAAARASPAKTSGGTLASRARAASARSSLGQSGWWSAEMRPPRGGRPGQAWSTAIGTFSVVSDNRADRAGPLRNPADGREAPRQLRRRLPPLGGPAARGRGLPPDRRPARDHGRRRTPRSCASRRSTSPRC